MVVVAAVENDPLPTTPQSLTGGKESCRHGNHGRAAKTATMKRKGGCGRRVKEEEEDEEEGWGGG